MRSSRSSTRTILLIGGLWLIAALIVGASGMLNRLTPPFPQLLMVSITLLLIVLGWKIESFRSWLLSVDERWIVALHLTRFVGYYFIYLYDRGRLPYEFAVPGGKGDIAVAALAIVLLVLG